MDTGFGKYKGIRSVQQVPWGSLEMLQDPLELWVGDGSCLGEGHLGGRLQTPCLDRAPPFFLFAYVKILCMILFSGSSPAKKSPSAYFIGRITEGPSDTSNGPDASVQTSTMYSRISVGGCQS